MLTLTPSAAAAVTTLLDNPDLPENASLRLQRGVDPTGEEAIGIAIVTGPEEGDAQVPVGPATAVFLAPDVAELLDDQELDADVLEDQAVSFRLRPQSVDGQPPEA